MSLKPDFLNTHYSMPFDKWQELMSETVEAIFDCEYLMESFKSWAQGQYNDYPLNDPEPMGDKRTREYRAWKRGYDTWDEVLGIAESCIIDSPVNVLDEMQTEIEQLYNNNRWDKQILEEAVYICATYVLAAKIQEIFEKKYYIMDDDDYIIGNEYATDMQLWDDYKWARNAQPFGTKLIRCEATEINEDTGDVTKIKLVKIVGE